MFVPLNQTQSMNQLLKQIQDRIKDLRAWQRENPRPKPLNRNQMFIGQTLWYDGLYTATVSEVRLATKYPSITIIEGKVPSIYNWVMQRKCWFPEYRYRPTYFYATEAESKLAKTYEELDAALNDAIDTLPELP